MKTIGSFEAKTHLSKLLDKVAKGESFLITKRGRPVASLSPAETVKSSKFPDPIGEHRKKWAGSLLKDFSLEEFKAYRDHGRK